jgi:ABC-type taurine transport system substrate-binding protein
MTEQMPDRIWASEPIGKHTADSTPTGAWGVSAFDLVKSAPYRLETPELLRALRIAAVAEAYVKLTESPQEWWTLRRIAYGKLKAAMEAHDD